MDELDEKTEIDEGIKEVMKNHDVDKDTAERATELMDEGLDEEDAVELAEEGI